MDETSAIDPSTLSNTKDFAASHLNWQIDVDFTSKTLSCEANQKFKCLQNCNGGLVLDSEALHIECVAVDNTNVEFKLEKAVGKLGQPLKIHIPAEKCINGAEFNLLIKYKTSPTASAAQWMQPEQTLGKKHPYLFTQCEAIHARSLLPCHDSPCHKITYSADITVPEELVALMSAVKGEKNPAGNGKKTFHFEQKVPIPSYLIAIAVGALECRTIGPRSKVWCEIEMVDKCQHEFEKVEHMLVAAESLMGPYVWGDYDILVLPPSFPFGGMENPCLTFATPTLIAGDRSLTNVIVHEITHSWTGNLVTNKTWEHFWLNEGFTRFIEDKIVGLLDGEKMRHFMAIIGWNDLVGDIEVFGPTNKLTALQPDLKAVLPDDAFSSVPYEKGSAFLFYIESLVGGANVFNPFLRSYIDHFKYKSLVTEDFKNYLIKYFEGKTTRLNEIDWEAWLHTPGMPPVNVIDMYDHTLSTGCQQLCERWVGAKPDQLDLFQLEDFSSFTTSQKIDFLSKLFQAKPLPLNYIQKMSSVYNMSAYSNVSEIEFGYLRLCVRAKWSEMYPATVKFITGQGRMKFVRPLYRELFKHEESKQLAIDTFEKYKHAYHNLAAAMISKDLHLAKQ